MILTAAKMPRIIFAFFREKMVKADMGTRTESREEEKYHT